MWAAVRQVTGKNQSDHVTVDGISASSLNLHYAAISADTDYQAPSPKQTSTIHPHVDYLSEWEVFRLLDTLHSTATGLDELPAWFIKLAASVFCQPITIKDCLTAPSPCQLSHLSGKRLTYVQYLKFLHLCLILTTDQYQLHQFYIG